MTKVLFSMVVAITALTIELPALASNLALKTILISLTAACHVAIATGGEV